MRAALVPLLLLAAAFAGCSSPPEPEGPSAPAAVTDGIVAYRGRQEVALPAGAADLAWRLEKTGFNGGEPSIGVTSDGLIFTTAGGAQMARSSDHGKTWTAVATATTALQTPKASLDPWIWVDPLTDRVYDSPLYVVCTWAAWSDDRGTTWDFNPAAGCGVPAHDHQKLTTGPPPPGVTVAGGYPDVVYYSYNSFRNAAAPCGDSCPPAAEQDGTQVTRSLDGGRNFDLSVRVHTADACHSGVASPVIAAPDGTIYSGKPRCEGVALASSKDAGATWTEPTILTDVGAATALAHMVDVATDAASNAYVTWTGEDGAAYLTRTGDGGATWSGPLRVSPPTLNATVFNVAIAGAAGRVAVGYLGTADEADSWDTRDAQSAAPGTRWHAYLSFTDDAWADPPTWTTVRLTPADDPVQVGCIWQSGGSNPCRNLADFIDLTQLGGRPYLVFADGCARCSTADQSRGAAVTVAILEGGPSLLGGALSPLVAG